MTEFKNDNILLKYETDFFSLCYDDEKKWLVGEWKGNATEKEFKELLFKEIEFINLTKTNILLVDALKYQGTSKDTEVWIKYIWTKLAYKAGLEFIAFVLPKNSISTSTMKRSLGDNFYEIIKTGFFDDVNMAIKWLDQVRNK